MQYCFQCVVRGYNQEFHGLEFRLRYKIIADASVPVQCPRHVPQAVMAINVIVVQDGPPCNVETSSQAMILSGFDILPRCIAASFPDVYSSVLHGPPGALLCAEENN